MRARRVWCWTSSRRAIGRTAACCVRHAWWSQADMPAVKDPYAALGVDKKASDEEIKRAYRKLARQYHPDTNHGDKQSEERFKEVQAAYAILSDPDKRKQ